MKQHEDSRKQMSEPVDNSELSDAELDETSGGIIIVGGTSNKTVFKNSILGKVSLNPQPLPPDPPPDHLFKLNR